MRESARDSACVCMCTCMLACDVCDDGTVSSVEGLFLGLNVDWLVQCIKITKK